MKLRWWIVIILFFLFASFAPSVYEMRKQGELQNRTFELVHNYYTDYHFYLSRIRQGAEGRWTAKEQYTSEPHDGSFLQIFYVLLGKPITFMQDTFLGSQIMYHSARLLFGFFFLFLIAWYVRKLFPSRLFQILAFLFAVTASSIPIIVPVGEGWRFGGSMSWWTIMDSLARITAMPHILLGQSLILFLLAIITFPSSKKRTRNIIISCVASFILAVVFPPGFLFVAVAYAITTVLLWCMGDKKEKEEAVRDALLRLIILAPGLIPMLYFQTLFQEYPWRRLVEFDIINPTSFSYVEYAKAVGLILPLGIMGLVVVCCKHMKRFLPLVSWVITWIILLCVFHFIPSQSPLRFTEMAPHIALGILAAVFVSVGSTWLYRKTQSLGVVIQTGLMIGFYFLTLLPIVLGLGFMYSSVLWHKDFIDQKIRAGFPVIPMNNYIVYPVTGFTDAMTFLEEKTPKTSVVLSFTTAGNFIPPYAGRTVYLGHDNTVKKEEKQIVVKQFFQCGMTSSEARTWIQKNRITHVYFGPEEKEKGSLSFPSCYPFLEKIYENPTTAVYEVVHNE